MITIKNGTDTPMPVPYTKSVFMKINIKGLYDILTIKTRKNNGGNLIMAYKQEKVFTKEVKKEIHDFCEKRWEFYKEKDGAYFPSKHDTKVFDDVSEHYGLPCQLIEEIFNEVSKEKAEAMVKGMNKKQMAQMFDQIVKGNAETPWGQAELKKNK